MYSTSWIGRSVAVNGLSECVLSALGDTSADVNDTGVQVPVLFLSEGTVDSLLIRGLVVKCQSVGQKIIRFLIFLLLILRFI